MTFDHSRQFGLRLFVLIAVLLLGSLLPAIAQDLRITDIRFWQSPEEAQIVLDLSGAPRVSPVQTLTDGTIFFDIEQCAFRPGRQNYPLNNSFVESLTVQERVKGGVRVFLKPVDGVLQRTFVLPANADKADRIVVFLSEPAAAAEARRAREVAEIGRLKSGNVRIVVIDPGHGGEDPGAHHNGIIEKDYVLQMSRLVKAYFDRDPRYKAIITRSGDYIIPLERRSQIAAQNGADVFVSIHGNFNRKRAIRGIEVYYESPKGASGEAERLLVDAENGQDIIGGVGSSIAASKQDIVQKQAEVMFQSRQLAEKAARRLGVAVAGLPLRGVKRAGFKVLHSTAMPSILVELGYMSNPQDVLQMRSSDAKTRMAQAIYLGVRDFLEGSIQHGYDAGYLDYVKRVEEEKKARAERIRREKERRARAIANSKPYKVKKGDTVKSVAKKFGVSLAELRDLNQFGKKRALKSGETIRIPGR
ncbi:MAG TPA: N-acetylmuramoyl-L-alanine amidase [Candidatus Ozemobacteraceae bacterium]